jgi:competence protein ComEC
MTVDLARAAPAHAQAAGTPPSIWRAPLVPVALAATAGIVVDRYFSPPLAATFLLGAALVIAWLVSAWRGKTLLALAFFWSAIGVLAAVYHHTQRDVYAPDDIGYFAPDEPHPVVLRGVVDSEPLLVKRPANDALRSFASHDTGRLVLQVTALKQQGDWQPVSGRVQVSTGKPVDGVHVGDEVEVAGRMQTPARPANPGEFDYAAMLRDQRIRAVVSVKDATEPVLFVRQPGGLALDRTLAAVRGWGQRTLTDYLPPDRQGVAIALLLGDGAPMTQDDWQKYIHTGVIHVLAISGQHLVVLAGFLAIATRLIGLKLRSSALFIALFLLGYSLLVGGRPPVMRSAVAVCCGCGALMVRRPLMRANTFALAWLAVGVLNPTDLFNFGCLLSFLAVAVLIWGTHGWWSSAPDPKQGLIEASRPLWLQVLRWIGRQVLLSYAITVAIWVVVAPLVAARQHVIAPVGLVIGPPTVLLTSIALLAGFSLLLLAPLCPPLAHVAAWVTSTSLSGCDGLVTWSLAWPGAFWYVPRIPEWWLWFYYLGVLSLLMLQTLRRIWQWGFLAILAWLTVGLFSGAVGTRPDELRCTFLAVGHGGCTVLETPDGRTFLYDAGSLRGPEVAQRQIAPYLWQRGIRRIDEVFLSHADLDHFNGLLALLDRFSIGQVSCTPTFTERQTNAVRATVRGLESRGVTVRVLKAGDHLQAGAVHIDVLHPPIVGPDGNENSRSLVLLVRHANHSVLLTGDLEGAGLGRVLGLKATKVDVLMAPHHGNRAATLPLIAWSKPHLIVSCQGPPRSKIHKDLTDPQNGLFLGTWPHGAITIRSRTDQLVVETYQTQERWRLPWRFWLAHGAD